MNKEEIKQELLNFHCPRWKDLPNFEIYMDQVIFFISDRFNVLYFNQDKDKIITSNMVNNYVKNTIVHPPIKKHYRQFHLAYLIAVTILKRCYSLSEISMLIEKMGENLNHDSIPRIYDAFSVSFEYYLHAILSGQPFNELQNPEQENYALMVHAIKTIVYKICTELELLEE